MARRRMIWSRLIFKEEFHALPPLLRVLCFGLILEADQTGKGCVHRAASGGIIATWRGSCRRSLRRMLPHLAAVSAVVDLHYWRLSGRLYWCLPRFLKHQDLKHIGPSQHPCCLKCGCRCERQCDAASRGMKDLDNKRKKIEAPATTSGSGLPAGSPEAPAGGPLEPGEKALLEKLSPEVRKKILGYIEDSERKVINGEDSGPGE